MKHGPCQHTTEMVQTFCRLVELYRENFVLFPSKMTAKVFRLNRDLLVVVVAQIHRCVEGRNSQPLLSATERKAGTYDAGALLHFEVLLNSMASSAVGTALSLCELSISREEGLEFPFRRTNLRCALRPECCMATYNGKLASGPSL